MVQMARESLPKKKKKNENDATPSLSRFLASTMIG
jgi:hypothetical protein